MDYGGFVSVYAYNKYLKYSNEATHRDLALVLYLVYTKSKAGYIVILFFSILGSIEDVTL